MLGATSVAQAIFRHFYLQGSREKYQKWLPNWGAIALGFVIPGSIYSTAALIGAIWAYVWQKWRPVSWETYGFAIAAGLIAGEGLGGVVGACLQLGGVSGDVYGTNIGCPALSC